MAPFFDTNGDPLMDPYTILCIPSTASESEIKKAYRMQMLQLHPDKLEPTLSENSIAAVTETFHNVKDAYEFLMSPVHLTSRRLYMAKMASRRAEYERREAYIRRHGGSSYSSSGGGSSNNMNSRAHTVPNNYSRGGGGAAGIAGTGMPRSSGNSGTAHAQRMRNMHRSQSEPGIQNNNINNRGKQQQQRSGGDNQARYYRGSNNHNMMHNSHRTGGGHRDHRNGYKSDGSVYRARRSKSRDYDRRHSNKTTHNQHRSARHERRRETRERQQHRSRGKSEPRRYKSTAATAAATQDNKRTTWDKFVQGRSRSQRRSRSRDSKEKKRRRAKSAPARSSRGRDRYTNNNKSKKDLPSNFYCPLTKRIYKDPVIDSEGNTYEREAIERWLRSQSSSPVTNNYLCVEMLKPNRELKRTIYKATGKPRSKSQSRPPKSSPSQEFSSGRVLVDSYLHEISNNSKLTVSLDGMGICAFKYRRITFVIEVPIDEHAGFMVYSSFDGEADTNAINKKIDAWNNWLSHIGRSSQVSYVKAGQKTVFTLKGNEFDMDKCNIFQKTLEYFIEMSLKLHNLLHPNDGMKKSVENVCLTKTPVSES